LAFRLIADGLHGASFDTAWVSVTKIADKRDIFVQLNGSDGAERLACPAGRAYGPIDKNLPRSTDIDSTFGTFSAISLRTVLTEYGKINSQFFDFCYLYSRCTATDRRGMKKCAVNFTAPTSRTFLRKKRNHFIQSIDSLFNIEFRRSLRFPGFPNFMMAYDLPD
jgi:hypothetical protein